MKNRVKKVVFLATLPSFLFGNALPALAAPEESHERSTHLEEGSDERPKDEREITQHLLEEFATLRGRGAGDSSPRANLSSWIAGEIEKQVRSAFPGYQLDLNDLTTSSVSEPRHAPSGGWAPDDRLVLLKQRLRPTETVRHPREITLSTLWLLGKQGSPSTPIAMGDKDQLGLMRQNYPMPANPTPPGQQQEIPKGKLIGFMKLERRNRILPIIFGTTPEEGEAGRRQARRNLTEQAPTRIFPMDSDTEAAWKHTLAAQMVNQLSHDAPLGTKTPGFEFGFSRKPAVRFLGEVTKGGKQYTLLSFDHPAVSTEDYRVDGRTRTFWALPKDPAENPHLVLIPPPPEGAAGDETPEAATKRVRKAVRSTGSFGDEGGQAPGYGIAVLSTPEENGNSRHSLILPIPPSAGEKQGAKNREPLFPL